jgi:hypothetical protein
MSAQTEKYQETIVDVLIHPTQDPEEEHEQITPEECNYWNWEWNPRCVCTECHMA